MVQVAYGAPSKLHLNVDPASVAEKSKLVLVEFVCAGGSLGPIDVSGGVVSSVKLRVAVQPDLFPAVSCACTCQSYVPSARPAGVYVPVFPLTTVDEPPLRTRPEHAVPAAAGDVQTRTFTTPVSPDVGSVKLPPSCGIALRSAPSAGPLGVGEEGTVVSIDHA